MAIRASQPYRGWVSAPAPWPFDDAPDTATITVEAILSGAEPVRLVCHDVADGGWQFLTGNELDNDRPMVVSLEDVVKRDPTLPELADLNLGWRATPDEPAMAWARTPRFATRWEDLLEQAKAFAKARQDRMIEEFALDTWKRWYWDQNTATITFSTDDVPGVRARIQVVGSLGKRSGTWLWSWDNASILEGAAMGVPFLRAFGEQHGFEKLVTACWPADEVDAWEMTAIACHLLDGDGVYKAPSEEGALFLVLSDPERLQ